MNETTDTPTRIAFMPDWREGVSLTQSFETKINRSRTGLEQRSRRRRVAVYRLAYTRTGLTQAEVQDRQAAIRTETRIPLIVPIWTDGIPTQSAMFDVTAATLDSNPITGEWVLPMDVFIWSPSLGGEWRTLASVSGRNLVFTGTGGLHPAGAWIFPSRLMIRERSDAALRSIDVDSGTESLQFRTL